MNAPNVAGLASNVAGMPGPGILPSTGPNASDWFSNPNLRRAMFAAGGAGLGGQLGASKPQTPPGPWGPPQLPNNPNFNQLLGNGRATQPNFTGYSPYASVSGAPFNFYQGG
jgi:hypothetical protein